MVPAKLYSTLDNLFSYLILRMVPAKYTVLSITYSVIW